MHVAIVTDSTAYLPGEAVARFGIDVVPLSVAVGDQVLTEGADVSPAEVAHALQRRVRVTTSRPTPEAFAAVYRSAAARGAEAVVSLHLSAEFSGTYEAAVLAAQDAPLPVRVVDTRMVAMALGYCVLTAAEKRAAATAGFFYVDTLEYLRRGGRIGSARALVGSALAVKPLLHLEDGRIQPLEKVRTSSRAIARLEEIAIQQAGTAEVDVTVHHLVAAERAEGIAERLRERIPGLRELYVGEVGAVIGAHVGPGLLAVVVSPW